MGFLKWIFEPMNRIGEEELTREVVIIRPGMPDFPESKAIYRPQCFGEYIGQSKAKSILKDRIQAMKERKETMGHVLLHGKAGCGKTTLAKIIANELGVPFREMTTSTIKDTAQLIQAIIELNGGVLFLDEIHGIDRSVAESIYSIMEDFKYNGLPVPKFTLIGATTELGELIKTRKPFVDRFKLPIELADYTLDELTTLTRQYRNVSFPCDTCDLNVYAVIATNCRRTPRIAIRLLESCIYSKGDIDKVLDNFDIIVEGYTHKDLEVLKYIGLNSKGVGVLGIASYLGTSQENYTQILEPYLLRNQLICRTPRGRKLTLAGENKIKELELAINVK